MAREWKCGCAVRDSYTFEYKYSKKYLIDPGRSVYMSQWLNRQYSDSPKLGVRAACQLERAVHILQTIEPRRTSVKMKLMSGCE